MENKEWKYYNHAAIPRKSPLTNPNLKDVKNGRIWKLSGKPLLARWTTDFDCGFETNWWYIIKDKPFDINEINSKKRYEIKKGRKYFCVKEIELDSFKDELFEIHKSALMTYSQMSFQLLNKEKFIKSIERWKNLTILGAFYNETQKMVGYAMLTKDDDKYLQFNVLKVIPEYEKYAINAAIVDGILAKYENFLKIGGIICDGARSINHETNFQGYLEKYFKFRKAYCILHIEYNPKIKWAVKILYPIRGVLKKFDGNKLIHNINSVLIMEEFVRGKV